MIRKLNISWFIFYLSIILFGLYPLIPERLESYPPIIFSVSSFILFVIGNRQGPKYKPLIFMGSLFLFFLISTFFSDNIHRGFKKIETMLSIIVFPVVCFWFLRNVKWDFNKIEAVLFKTFFSSTIVFSLIAFYMLNFYRNPKFSTKDSDFFRNAITDIPYIGDHSIYVSLFIAIAILMGFSIFSKLKKGFWTKLVIILGILVLTTLLLLLMSKGVILGLIMSLLVVFIFKKKSWKKIILIGILIILLGFVLLPKQNNRFIELFKLESFEKVDLSNSTSVRFFVLKSSFGLVLESPIFGYGLGDVQNELDMKYAQNDLRLPKGKYNSHNQYLFVWLSCGAFGLIVFILSLVYIFNLAIGFKDYFLLGLLILYIVSFLFENVLSRQSGVILFAFLMNFLILKNLNGKVQNTLLK
ncbi:O-antigen ligase family protein [Seonamhaeicola sp. MEBiC1930]|uniref:O-antigen ligase family protein n=1 Tax=Seonamhaeicola sp. MEBiC01930 TaxID=2976768 RepID=UPI003249D41A